MGKALRQKRGGCKKSDLKGMRSTSAISRLTMIHDVQTMNNDSHRLGKGLVEQLMYCSRQVPMYMVVSVAMHVNKKPIMFEKL